MVEIQAPNSFSHVDDTKTFSVFFGGSIEMNTAEKWQERLAAELKDYDIVCYNPRRADWDSTITQSITDQRFNEQVTWELNALDAASLIVFYFDPNTKSPITLLELGLFASKGNVIVCCPDGFWRKGNVEIVCNRYGVKLENTFDNLLLRIKHIFTHANVPRCSN
jgi:hypothetical protein